MKLSIVIPVFNEEKTIGEVLEKVLDIKIPKIEKEIIVVDDGSTDTTASVVSNIKYSIPDFKMITLRKNQGKGMAVKSGIKTATGDYILIQDADLEYNPEDIKKLLVPVFENKAKVVYGTRLKRPPDFSKDERTVRFFIHYSGNKFLSLITSVLYGQWITDMETGYKLFKKDLLEGVNIKARGFEFEPEITAKLLKKGLKIIEIPISTNPRDYSEGKKLNTFRDGFMAIWSLLKFRFTN